MEVILRDHVDNVGKRGDVVKVADGFARNYLLPRKLAYEIGHHKEGFYVLEVITGSGELMKEIDRRLKVTEGLLRHLVVRVDESSIKADRARTKRTEESRRRRIARGLPPDRQPGEGPQGMDDDDANDMMFDGPDMEER